MSIAVHPDWLRAFIAFAEARSFTAAARALHLTQPAVHMQVKKLGEALSVELYRRQGRALALTEAGERVLAHARDVIEREAMLRAELDGADEAPVRVAAGEGAFLYLLADGVRAVARDAEVSLRLTTTSAEGAVEAVRSGRAHLAVAVLAELPDGLDGRALTRVGAKVVMRRDHPLARRRRLTPRHLDGQTLVLPPRGRPHREAVVRALEDAGATAEVCVEAHGWEVLMSYAGLGLGVAVVNGICRTPRGLVARPFGGLPRVTYWLLHRPGALRRAAVRAVFDAFVAHVPPP